MPGQLSSRSDLRSDLRVGDKSPMAQVQFQKAFCTKTGCEQLRYTRLVYPNRVAQV